MSERTSTIRAREIGGQLRRFREHAGFSQHGAGKKICLSTASMCRIEDGTKTPTPEEVASLLTVYEVRGPVRDTLIEIAREAAERGWWQRHNPEFGRRLNTLASLESRACTITTFELSVIPGLLQAQSYIEALMRGAPDVSEREVAHRVEGRLARQRILTKSDPVHLMAFIDESVLLRVNGSAAVMHRQVDHLLTMTERPNVIIRVVPFARGARAALIKCFHLLRFPHAPSVVHTTNWGSDLFLEDRAEIDHYDVAVKLLLESALDTGQSIALMTEHLRELETDPDVLPPIPGTPLAEE